MKLFAKNFRQAIELLQKDIGSQAFMAKKMNMLPQSLNNIMLERAHPTIHHVCILSVTYGISADWLITGEGPMFRDSKRLIAGAEAAASAAKETKEAWQQANQANRALAEARQEIIQLTRENMMLKEANTEGLKPLDPKEQLKYKKGQEKKMLPKR